MKAFWIIAGGILVLGGVCFMFSVGILLIPLGIASILFGLQRDIPNRPEDEDGRSSYRETLMWIVIMGVICTIIAHKNMSTYLPKVPLDLVVIRGFSWSTFILAMRDPVRVRWAILTKNPQSVPHKLSSTVSLILFIALYVLHMVLLSRGTWR